jgi:hypothetical protein
MMRTVLVVAVLALLAPMSHAQTALPDSENGRFTFHQVQDGVLRLDSRTGQLSVCANKQAVGWTCQAVPDERSALEAEIARQQGENAALKKDMLARGMPLPGGVKANPPSTIKPEIELKLPSEADIDRLMTFMEKIWRRLVDMVQNLQKDMDKKG